MKKLLIVSLAICLIFALAACGETSKTEDNPADSAKYPAGTVLNFGDNLPEITLSTAYNDFDGNLQEFWGDDTLQSLYVPVNEDSNYWIAIYRWKNDDNMTLMELAQYDVDHIDINEGIEPAEFHQFNEPGDFDYVFYMFYQESENFNYYGNDYYFNDGDDIVIIEFLSPTRTYEIDDTTSIELPFYMKPLKPSDIDSDNLNSAFVDIDGHEANLYVYRYESENATLDTAMNTIKSNFKCETSEKTTLKDVPALHSEFIDEEEGIEYTNWDYILDLGGKLIELDFWFENNEAASYAKVAVPAFINCFHVK